MNIYVMKICPLPYWTKSIKIYLTTFICLMHVNALKINGFKIAKMLIFCLKEFYLIVYNKTITWKIFTLTDKAEFR